MKIVGEYLSDGKVIVIPQNSDDLYYIYNTLAPKDRIIAKTSRKIKRGEQGVSGSERITVIIELEIEEIEFHGFGDNIRVRGIIKSTSEETVSIGSYHSINIDLYQKLTIIKDNWKRSELERLRNAQMGKSSPLVVVSMDDQRALISQVGSHASKILLEMEPSIPRKGSDLDQHQEATKDYFDELAIFLKRQREEGVARYIVIGGPGFTKDAFYEHIKIHHPELNSNLQVVETKSAGRSGIKEIVSEKIPDNFAAGQDAKQQANLINEVLEVLGKDTGHIAYGSDIPKAVEMGAVDKLLVLDSEMRDTVEKRQEINELIENVEDMGGNYVLMSSMHDSGEILKGLGGIVALLRFKLPK